jgi:putative DNA-invertase from lambdoid prophage Rac
MSIEREPVKCASLLRVSTGHQEASNQEPDVERFNAHHGYQEVKRYWISESAWNGGKDGGEYKRIIKEILEDAWAGHFEVLTVWALDRITREGAEGALRIIRQLRERGCTLLSVKEPWLNSTPEIQDILIAFAGWSAQMESQRRSDRIRAGLARRKAEGKPVGGRKAGAKDRRKREHKTGAAAGWTEERKAQLILRNQQRAQEHGGVDPALRPS